MKIKKRVVPVVIIQFTDKEAKCLLHQLEEYAGLPEEISKGDKLTITKLQEKLRSIL